MQDDLDHVMTNSGCELILQMVESRKQRSMPLLVSSFSSAILRRGAAETEGFRFQHSRSRSFLFVLHGRVAIIPETATVWRLHDQHLRNIGLKGSQNESNGFAL